MTDLLTVSQVATLLQVGAATVRRWVREDHLPAVRLPSGGIRIRQAALDAIVALDQRPSAGAPPVNTSLLPGPVADSE
jgi:excisionase family DNA binding protein